MSERTDHPLHPVNPDGFCVWLNWCTRPECNRPSTPWELIGGDGEWAWGNDL